MKTNLDSKIKYTGTLIGYFFTCKREMWFFHNRITFEHNSENVKIGKLISEKYFQKEHKEVNVDDTIVIDWIDYKRKIIHEVKKSDKSKQSHIWQTKYYIYYLKQKGLMGFRGIINYPKLHKREIVELSIEDEKTIEEAKKEIFKIITNPLPPEAKKIPICKGCSYYSICWI